MPVTTLDPPAVLIAIDLRASSVGSTDDVVALLAANSR